MRQGSVVLIVSDAADPVPWWVGAALDDSAARLRPLVVDTNGLVSAGWSLRVSPVGRATSVVQLPQERLDDELRAVWCCARTLPMPGFMGADPRDGEYAASEMRALVVGWLRSLGKRVVNPVDGDGLTGPSWTPIRWLVEGARCGLRTVPVTMATSGRSVAGWRGTPYDARRPVELSPGSALSDSLVVVGRQVIGELAPELSEACLALAGKAQCRLLELSFVKSDDDWLLASADPVPMLRTAIQVRAVADLLTAIAASDRAGSVA